MVQEEQQESIYPNISCSWTFYQVVPPHVSCLEVFVGGVDVCLSKSTLSFQPSKQRNILFQHILEHAKMNRSTPYMIPLLQIEAFVLSTEYKKVKL